MNQVASNQGFFTIQFNVLIFIVKSGQELLPLNCQLSRGFKEVGHGVFLKCRYYGSTAYWTQQSELLPIQCGAVNIQGM